MTPQTEKLFAGSQVLDLTTTGRKSGLPRTVELWFAYHEGYVYFLTGSTHWSRNLEAHPEATLHVKRRMLRARLEPLADPAGTKPRVTALFREKYGPQVVAQWYEGHDNLPVRLKVLP
ncbi:MAG: nitroreductase family deazaflavin-dependent oxidoreductase [Chloroflexi bacterium]|nr:nitroreductase family deazaflavin-dependent oxidoreductase [Chloroflexota bacterium]